MQFLAKLLLHIYWSSYLWPSRENAVTNIWFFDPDFLTESDI